MKVIPLTSTILDRHLAENARATAEDVKAVQDYNIMMGIMEDPSAEETEEENNG